MPVVVAEQQAALDLAADAAQGGGRGAATLLSAVSYLRGHIHQLSFVKGIDDVFIIAAILTIAGFVPSFFLKKGGGGGGMAMAAE